MKVQNVHERAFPEPAARVGALIDSLASPDDALWPRRSWPRMQFDRPLAVGADGGHGPIRYFVKAYTPGRRIEFQFTGPVGFDGYHGYEIVDAGSAGCVLRHALEMTTRGRAVVTWPVIYRPLHDALIEDSLATAETALGNTPFVQPWSLRVRLLRWVLSGGRKRPQVIAPRATPR